MRGPFVSTAARRLPGPEASRLVTAITWPPRPPVAPGAVAFRARKCRGFGDLGACLAEAQAGDCCHQTAGFECGGSFHFSGPVEGLAVVGFSDDVIFVWLKSESDLLGHDVDDDPSVAGEPRRAVVGHGEDDVHGARAGRHHPAGRDREPGLRLVEVLNVDGLAGAGVGDREGAGLVVVEPLVGERIAVGIGRAGGAEIDAFAGFGGESGGMSELRLRADDWPRRRA